MSISTQPIIRQQVSLKSANTFGLDVTSAFQVEITRPDDLLRVMDSEAYQNHPHYILGGGSNVLFVEDYPGLVIKNSIPDISVISEDDREVIIKAGAGVAWDELVLFSLDQDWGGLENLSMIPGRTGAAPIQNIGAYGVELEQVFVSLEAISLKTGETGRFDKSQCRFGYRDSVFKSGEQHSWVITSVTLRLDKQPQIQIDYGNLREVLARSGITKPTIHDVSRAVREIRSSKLPDPAVTGNAGSFFKNPAIARSRFTELQQEYSDIPGFAVDGQRVKVPAAWLIDRCGFKGKRAGDAGIHERHALILVNYGKATGKQLITLAMEVKNGVFDQFGITLEPEVNIIGASIPNIV